MFLTPGQLAYISGMATALQQVPFPLDSISHKPIEVTIEGEVIGNFTSEENAFLFEFTPRPTFARVTAWDPSFMELAYGEGPPF